MRKNAPVDAVAERSSRKRAARNRLAARYIARPSARSLASSFVATCFRSPSERREATNHPAATVAAMASRTWRHFRPSIGGVRGLLLRGKPEHELVERALERVAASIQFLPPGRI